MINALYESICGDGQQHSDCKSENDHNKQFNENFSVHGYHLQYEE
jgi:hypothetical protein